MCALSQVPNEFGTGRSVAPQCFSKPHPRAKRTTKATRRPSVFTPRLRPAHLRLIHASYTTSALNALGALVEECMRSTTRTLVWLGIALILITGLVHLIDAPDAFEEVTYK